MHRTAFLAVLLAASLGSTISAQNTFDQDVTIVVQDSNVLSVSSSTVTLTLSATAGSNPTDTDNSTTYNITTNGTSKKLTGQLGAAYASGISLDINLTAPTGGSSTQKTLTTSAQDLVTGFGQIAESGLGITYSATATPSAVPNGAGEQQTVTVTLTDA
jgi:hypothetical protein